MRVWMPLHTQIYPVCGVASCRSFKKAPSPAHEYNLETQIWVKFFSGTDFRSVQIGIRENDTGDSTEN